MKICNSFNGCNGKIEINGVVVEVPNSRNVTVVNNKLYVNGKEYNFKTKTWKITFKSVWYFIF